MFSFQALLTAFRRFNVDEDWALASHIALSTLMALFPFAIVLSSLAHFLSASEVADDVVGLMFETWPKKVSDHLSSEIREIVTASRGNLLTINLLLAIYFASSGIESLRIGLNRAYGVVERRSWIALRLRSIVYVLITAVALMTLGFLIVLGPMAFVITAKYAPWIGAFEGRITLRATASQQQYWYSLFSWFTYHSPQADEVGKTFCPGSSSRSGCGYCAVLSLDSI